MVEVCKNNKVIIFNGRIGEDMGAGKYSTTYKTTIDYVLGTCNTVKQVNNFKVLDFEPLFSDVHCGLHTVLEFSCESRQSGDQNRDMEETTIVRPGKWRHERKGEYVKQVDVSRVYELFGLVDDLPVEHFTHQLKLVLIEPALKVFPQRSDGKYIKISNKANINGYEKQCHKARKEYHKAKRKNNKHKNCHV